MLDWLPYAAIALIAVAAAVQVFRVDDDDPEWETRWRSLRPADRTRIKAAVDSGALLADPEEIELAAGLARRSRWSGYTAAYLPRLILAAAVGAALLIAGLVTDSAIFIVFGAIFLLPTIWSFQRQARIDHNQREAISRGRGS